MKGLDFDFKFYSTETEPDVLIGLQILDMKMLLPTRGSKIVENLHG